MSWDRCAAGTYYLSLDRHAGAAPPEREVAPFEEGGIGTPVPANIL
jgi:hypothetical protein